MRGKIALADLDPFIDARPSDVKALLTRLQALEDLERQVFLLQAKPYL